MQPPLTPLELVRLGLRPASTFPSTLVLPSLLPKVAAGFPSPADDYLEEGVDLNRLLVRNAPSTFFYQVESCADSMDQAGILGGDRLVVDRSIEPRSGHVVVAMILGEGATVKRLKLGPNSVKLVPESSNPKHRPRIFRDGDEVLLIGVVTSVIRQLPT